MTPTLRERPLILIVDDTPANLSVLVDLLSVRGFEISVAEDGESALEQADYVRPDLILLDVMMPNMDGFTACRLFKERPDTQDIPIIFMTALTDTVDKVKGFGLGAVDYITKPFQVLARVTTHLSLQRLKQRHKEDQERLARIIESAMDAIITVNQDGRITLFNRAAERVFRCSAIEAIGQPCKRFLSHGLCQMLTEYVSGGQAEGLPRAPIWVPESHSALRADGQAFPIEASLSCAEAGGQAIYTLILRDIEERKKAEAEVRQLRGLTSYLEEELRVAQEGEQLIGNAGGLREVMSQVRQVASTDATVLVTGETGTGKELIAQAIHKLSQRREKPLVKLNCAALPENLIESELFGHEKGAFTGALARKPGRFELADGGTLFLDEVGELPLNLQSKLLRVLQEGEFERLGGTHTLKVDVRIVAATNRDLGQCAKEGQFRPDLYYRLNVFPISLPPLRERREDVAPLVAHFVHKYAAKYEKRIETVAEAQLAAIQRYAWPGNVRELQHVLERAVILTEGTCLALGNWFQEAGARSTAAHLATLDVVEREHILKVLEATGGRLSGKDGAAELLGLKYTTLQSRMQKLGITRNL
ncbi:MAG: sigma 54-interacting transcriptional regulator [Gammaproteobacteria bacterium]